MNLRQTLIGVDVVVGALYQLLMDLVWHGCCATPQSRRIH
jgi:hypothetical protein